MSLSFKPKSGSPKAKEKWGILTGFTAHKQPGVKLYFQLFQMTWKKKVEEVHRASFRMQKPVSDSIWGWRQMLPTLPG